MRTIRATTVLTLTLLASAPAFAQDPKAHEVLSAARQALGGEDALAAIAHIAARGTHRRSMGEMQATGETSLEISMPDRYLRTVTDQMFGNSITLETGFEGSEPIQRSSSSGGGPGVFIRMAGPGGPGEADADPATLKAYQLRAQHADFARLMLGWIATAPAFMEPTYSYAGEAESPDGRADVIDIKAVDGFAARLFVDRQTHRPLMLTYMGTPPMVRVVRERPGEGHTPGADAQGRRERAETSAREMTKQKPAMVEIQMFFDDYRKVGQVWLPHHLSRAINGETTEEVQFDKIELK